MDAVDVEVAAAVEDAEGRLFMGSDQEKDEQTRLLTDTPIAFIVRERPRFMLQVHVTEKCNLRCQHCYNESWTRDLSMEHFLIIVKQFKRLLKITNTGGTVYLTGGEPLLWPHLLDAIQILTKERIPPRVFTNGTLITADMAKQLSDSRVRFVQVSLDGAQETNDSIRGEKSFDKAITGIKHLLHQGIEVTLMVTVMKRNLSEIDQLLDLADELGVQRIAFNRFIPIGSGSDLADEALSSAEVQEMLLLLRDKSGQHQVEIIQRDPLWTFVNQNVQGFSGCSAGQFLLAVLVDGTVYPCRRLPIDVGNVFEKELVDIWVASPLLRDLRDRRKLECGDCAYLRTCGGCRGVAYAKTGDPYAMDPQCFKKREKTEAEIDDALSKSEDETRL